MANSSYGKAREAIQLGSIDLLGDDIKLVLIDDASYTVSIDVDEFLDDIAGGARTKLSGNFASKVNPLGVFDAADVTLTLVTGAESEALVIYQDTGVEATSRLLIYIDTATGLPVIPNGLDIIIQWNAAGIWRQK